MNRTLVIKIALACIVCTCLYTIGGVLVYALFSANLPNIDELETTQPKRVTRVYAADGQHLMDFREENREIIREFDEIPLAMRDALISIEDRRFFTHWGIDLRRILGAVIRNISVLDPTREGASTITQQLARNLYQKVGGQRSSASLEGVLASYARKVREQITAVHVERLYTKREILVMYLNTVFFGHDAWGLKSAARLYFDKEIADLRIEECAMLAGLLKAPNTYSPHVNPERARERRNLVLWNMIRAGKLTKLQYQQLESEPVHARRGQQAETYGLAPYFVEFVRKKLYEEHGASLYRDGFSVSTTIDAQLQQIAESHYNVRLRDVQRKVDAAFEPADSVEAANPPIVQAAFVAMDPVTGHILAMIGGRDFRENEFNRATQATRQAGSSFKPFVYTAAIDNGRFPVDMFEDNAIVVEEQNGDIWDPENYDRKFKGPMTLRQGFKESRNIIAVKLAREIGPGRVRQYARAMGITTPIPEVYSVGIGVASVRLLEMVAAYAVFPNKGIHIDPVGVSSIADSDSNIIFQSTATQREVLRPSVAVVMTDLMRSVMDEAGGTGYSARTRYHFRVAAAGKTGTTNDYRDAWFIGFTPHIVAGVWVGVDDPVHTLARQAGAGAALPMWAGFMKEVYEKVPKYRDRRRETFDYPEELVTYMPVCEDSHRLATRYCPRQSDEIFLADGVPPGTCPLHGVADTSTRRQRRF
ncbi:MAG: PBP1A family penicillin-binding protein [Gemmatimonadetes bacterium]|jgi:penicillin-binding protein 1A|nr:PBP1A family penicillin-binding protein [Gemmatimonadota bacterium]MBT6147947.1 PBP1A family penicillin-binding protein [Gemmatimonadota bacterium]MBT7860774.1 PBP1A family penicillin-binding protein [Gemmatimonadota bacterium]